MASRNDTGTKTFRVAAAIGQYLRVKLDSVGTVSLAGLSDRSIGATNAATFAVSEPVTVELNTKPGTSLRVASKAIAIGANVYGAANGKVSDTKGTGAYLDGIAITAASADGDVIEIMPVHGAA